MIGPQTRQRGLNIFDWYTDERGEYLATLPELREVYLTGGEPMMVKGLHKFLQKLRMCFISYKCLDMLYVVFRMLYNDFGVLV